jgi:DNA repair exonuclease SbcCD nuclease subunit
MLPFRFIHAADLHLDTPFEGIGSVDQALQQRLRDASLEAFDKLIAAAVDRHVDFLVISGDIYEGAKRGARAQARFLEGLRTLDRHGIRSFWIHGNHDPVQEAWSAIRRDDLPTSAAQFDQTDTVRAEVVLRDGQPIAAVHGISFRERNETRNLSCLFSADGVAAPFHIGLLHTNVGGRPGHDNCAPCTVDDLRARGMDYWALGHIHLRLVLQEAGPTIVYAGNLQARSFREAEPKGALLVQVDSARRIQLEPLDLDVVRFARVPVDASSCESLDDVLTACENALDAATASGGGRFVLGRVELRGRTQAHADLLRAHEQEELVVALRDRLPGDRCWLDDLRLSTGPAMDREAIGRAAGFEASLVALTNELLAEPEKSAQWVEEIRSPLRNGPRFKDYLGLAAPDELNALLGESESLLLGLLQEEGEK